MTSTGFWRQRLSGALEIVSLFAIAGTVFGFFGRYHWFFDLFAHFRIQYCATLLVSGPLFLCLRRPWIGGACLFAGTLLAASMAHYFVPVRTTLPSASVLRVVSFNVNTANREFDAVVRFLAGQSADVVFLMEVNDEWMSRLEPLRAQYPHFLSLAREDNFGVALLSRHHLSTAMVHEDFDDGTPMIDAALEVNGHVFRLLGVHPVPPTSGEASLSRNAYLARAARVVAATHERNALIVGDFNLTPFSAHFVDLLESSGLRDSRVGFGLWPTWMRHQPWFSLPIDHALVSDGMTVHRRRCGPSLGSDHNPLILDVTGVSE